MIRGTIKLYLLVLFISQDNALNVVNQRIPTSQNITSPSNDYFTNKDPKMKPDFCHHHNATCNNTSKATCRTCKCKSELVWMSFAENGCRSRMYLYSIVNGV